MSGACGRQRTASVGRRPAWLRPAARMAWVAVVVAALAAPVPTWAATYKWVDENGVVHYTDKMPPEAVNRGSVELSKQGVPVRKTDPALTPEQRRAREQEAERQVQAKKTQDEIARRDRALLASYSSEPEIDLARNRTLATIDTAVQSANAYSEQLSRRRSELMARKAGYGDKPVPPALLGELDSLNAEITRQTELIARKKGEAVNVAARYDADKQRWRELMAAKAAAEAAGKAGGATTAATGAVPAGGR